MNKHILNAFIFFLISSVPAFAEHLTLTTYYPSPSGDYQKLSINNVNESTTLANFTQALTNAGISIVTEYTNGSYTPGIFWSTSNDNPTKPKAGIWMKQTSTGSYLQFGTSNAYATGITNQAMTIDYSGNVGVGTETPAEKLDVNGVVRLAQTSSPGTTTDKLYNVGGVLKWNGATLGGSSGWSTGIGTVYTTTVSDKVGIGTATPAEKLDVNGVVRLAQTSAPGTTTDKLYNVGGVLKWNGATLGGSSGWSTGIGTVYTTTVSDKVGIGTATPAEKLDVNGVVRLAQTSAPVTTTDKLYNVGGVLKWNGATLGGSSGWSTGIGTVYTTTVSDKVGIGTATPAEKLDVNGVVRLAQTSAPVTTTDKLYNVGGTLTWNGTALGGFAPATTTTVSLAGNDGGGGFNKTQCPSGYYMTGLQWFSNTMTIYCERLK